MKKGRVKGGNDLFCRLSKILIIDVIVSYFKIKERYEPQSLNFVNMQSLTSNVIGPSKIFMWISRHCNSISFVMDILPPLVKAVFNFNWWHRNVTWITSIQPICSTHTASRKFLYIIKTRNLWIMLHHFLLGDNHVEKSEFPTIVRSSRRFIKNSNCPLDFFKHFKWDCFLEILISFQWMAFSSGKNSFKQNKTFCSHRQIVKNSILVQP